MSNYSFEYKSQQLSQVSASSGAHKWICIEFVKNCKFYMKEFIGLLFDIYALANDLHLISYSLFILGMMFASYCAMSCASSDICE